MRKMEMIYKLCLKKGTDPGEIFIFIMAREE